MRFDTSLRSHLSHTFTLHRPTLSPAMVFTLTGIILPIITAADSATESDWSEGNAY